MKETPSFSPESNGESREGAEKNLLRFIYVDHSQDNHPVIFECLTTDIALADAQYEAKFGVKPERQNHIGCSIIKN